MVGETEQRAGQRDAWARTAHAAQKIICREQQNETTADQQHKLVHAIDKAYKDSLVQIRPARDRRLAGILRGLERSKKHDADKPVGLPNTGEFPAQQ